MQTDILRDRQANGRTDGDYEDNEACRNFANDPLNYGVTGAAW
jgi:hypothetical protein